MASVHLAADMWDAGAVAPCQCVSYFTHLKGEVTQPCVGDGELAACALDLVQPLAAGRQLIGFGWEARRDEPGRFPAGRVRCNMRKQIELGRGECNFHTPKVSLDGF